MECNKTVIVEVNVAFIFFGPQFNFWLVEAERDGRMSPSI